MDSATSSQTSRSGITTSADGQRHIASSTRADGSKRKEIKIRPGYRPPEDVEVYKNRTAEAWKNRGTVGVPGASAAGNDDGTDNKTASNKNAKRREARKRAKAAEEGKDSNGTTDGQAPVKEQDGWDIEVRTADGIVQKTEVDEEAEKEKKVKKLKKKLREARELKAKKDKGEGLLPEQFEKAIRINELIKDLDKLGVSDEGEEKA